MRNALVLFGAFVFLCFGISKAQQTDFASKVNPFIGTGGHGHTYPGSTVPFGMVQLSPDTRIDGSWDGCSGYHYSDSLIYGFSHTHLSGTGCTDYGDIMIMPLIKAVKAEPLEYASRFSHKNETSKTGYYKVMLDREKIGVELTSSKRVGYHRYTFPKGAEAKVILDLNHRDKLLAGSIKKVNEYAIEGFRESAAWATKQLVYFYMEFNKPMADAAIENLSGINGRYGSTLKQSVLISFGKIDGPLEVKVSLSSVDEAAAKANMTAEVPGWNFEQVRAAASAEWNRELSKIEVKGGTEQQQTVFYTALYHCMTQPNTYNDVDGRYRGRDRKIHTSQNGDYYSVFSLWDTFRGLHPLLTVIDQKRTSAFINTFIRQYKEGGRLPVWELSCNETECMIGYHAVPVITEAMVKGVTGFNYAEAYEAAKHSAMLDHFGLDAYKKKGFIETDDEHESVSKTLEYAYDDWCIAQMAGLLGKKDDYNLFMKRSYSWMNLFDAKSGHMRPRYNGGWFSPFDPRQVDNNFTEANSWQYSFFVPHQLPELVKANGGLKKFEERLDELFTTSSQTTGREQSDITGLIGQYAHGNEPSHHMAYLYSLIGKAPKTQKQIRFILDNFYKNDPDGLIGNEDCGQMSAWYVWSAMGMYSSCPGKSYYTIGTPLFPEVMIHLENGKDFTIRADKPGSSNFYIQQATLNGTELKQPVLQYTALAQGGTLAFKMGNQPAANWTIPETDKKPEESDAWKFEPAPLIATAKQVFRDSIEVKILSPVVFRYTVNDRGYRVNKKDTTFWLKESARIVVTPQDTSGNMVSSSAQLYKIANDWEIKIKSKYNPQYTAGGDEGLIDGLRGDVNWRKGRWQGYQGQDVEVLIDLKKPTSIHAIGASFLQDAGAWIVFPDGVQTDVSDDGKTWTSLPYQKQNTASSADEKTQVTEVVLQQEVKTRYVRMKLVSSGVLPPTHLSAGSPSFIFVDEVIVK
ncbi:MAG: GH92 family glycosyl hydrolase [Bacteroidota bacterium]